jgi:iron complex transport system ATP-binding protein
MKTDSGKLEIRGLCVELGGVRILNDLSANFAAGSISAIIGPNGSGKSTLAKAVCGLLDRRCVRGDIAMDGRDVLAMKGRERARRIAVFPQTRPIPNLSVMEMISHGRYPYREPGGGLTEKDRRAISLAADVAGVGHLLMRKLATLSGGERQKAYIAMMLAQDAELLVLDEPTAHLDISAQLGVLHILKSQRRASKTILVVLHDIPQAFGIADAIYVMRNGRMDCSGDPDTPSLATAVEDAFGVGVAQSGDGSLYGYSLYGGNFKARSSNSIPLCPL